jgi:hypothetical protein
VIHLALEISAFLFLCWVGLIVLGIVAAILGSMKDALGKSFRPSRPPSSKTPFALGHDPIEPNHDPRTCPLCLGSGHRDDSDLYARAPRGMSTEELHRWAAQERERVPEAVLEQERKQPQVEAPKQETPLQHIPGRPWGDPSSYIRASTPDELERAREALHRREAERRDALAAKEREGVLEQERKKREDEKREQEAREYLIRESQRVLKEREEQEVQRKPQEPEPDPIASAPLIIVRPPSDETEAELCKCGYPGCLGHEVINGQIIFPGFTSEAAMTRSQHELVYLNVEVTGVAGNPSDGTLPASAIRTHRERRN